MTNGERPPGWGRIRLVLAAAGALALATAAPGLGGVNAGAQESGSSFAAVAVANGARLSYSVPGFLVVDTPIDGGGAVAQSVLESSGLSRSFASMPYPGDIAVTAGGTLASFGVAPAGALAYPLHVAADHPGVPESRTADPSGQFSLTAKAEASSSASTARAMAGPPEAPVGGTVADSSVVKSDDGTVTATATTLTQGVSLGDGALTIAAVRSRSVTVVRPGAQPTTTSETTVQGARVGDTEVTLGPDGVQVAGQPAPVPVADASNSLNDALAEAGLSINLVEAPEVKGGRSATVVEIRSRHPLPLPGDPQGFLVIRLGGATTAVLTADVPGADLPFADVPATHDPAEPSPVPPAVLAPVTATAPAPLPAAGPVTGAGGAPARRPLSPAVPAVDPPAAPETETGLAAAPAGPVAATPPAPVLTPVRAARDLRDETSVVFGVIGLAGALLVGGTLAWGSKGVKVRWTDF